MRTTLNLAYERLRHRKARAALQGRRLRAVTLELIGRGLRAAATPAKLVAKRPLVSIGQRIPAPHLRDAGLFDLLTIE